jgi:hypothetical protein
MLQRCVLPPSSGWLWLFITLMMEAICTSETSVCSNKNTRCYIPEGSNLHTTVITWNLMRFEALTVVEVAALLHIHTVIQPGRPTLPNTHLDFIFIKSLQLLISRKTDSFFIVASLFHNIVFVCVYIMYSSWSSEGKFACLGRESWRHSVLEARCSCFISQVKEVTN